MTTTPWTVLLGHDSTGAEVWRDVSKGPHMLLCGTSGSGKSVGLEAILCGLIQAGSPSDTRITVLDPKRVQFNHWRQAPHVAAVVTARDDMLAAVQSLVVEMDRRYALMERLGVQEIGELEGRHAMPRLFLVCDELADLTMASRVKADNVRAGLVLGCLTRLAQLGRAAGVHLIVATQRPAADTLPGNLRANLGTRWAFRVRTRAESRIALDAPGAESLGAEPGTSLVSWRGAEGSFVQGRYVSRDDCLAIVAAAVETYGRRGGVGGSVRPSGGMRGVRGADVWERLPAWAQGIVGLGAVAWVFYCMATFGGSK